MNVQKATLTTNGKHIEFSMPIVKVNKESRVVSGYATLDNVDTQGDIVTSEASEKAFNTWRGNIREMHAPVAVGKLLSFEPQTVFNAETGETLKGIYVNVYVSKGAESTWEKVLDGTLTGFSIGGSINKAENIIAKANDGSSKRIRKVTDYQMTELSLVDNPANQLANIVSFQKTADGVEVSGMIAEMNVENIFYCSDDTVAVTSPDETANCNICNKTMTNIGWVENEDDKKNEVIKASITKFVANNPLEFASEENVVDNNYSFTINVNGANPDEIVEQVRKALNQKGGVTVSEEVTKTVEPGDAEGLHASESVGESTVSEEGQQVAETVDETPAAEETADGEQAASVSEVEEPDLQKMFTDLTATLTGAINSAKAETEKALSGVSEGFEKAVSGIDSKVSELAEKFSTLEERVNGIDEHVGGVEKRVDSVESDTAIKKSGDLGGASEKEEIKKSIWSGVFLPADNLAN